MKTCFPAFVLNIAGMNGFILEQGKFRMDNEEGQQGGPWDASIGDWVDPE